MALRDLFSGAGAPMEMKFDKRTKPVHANDHMTVAHLQNALENSQSPAPQEIVIKHMTMAHIAEALTPNAPAPAPAANVPTPAATTSSPQPKDK
jgi:hypothetical protein